MTAPSTTGTIAQIDSSSSSSSQSVTVPTDAELCLCLCAGWTGDGSFSASLGGSSMTSEIELLGWGNQNIAILYLTSPSTGSQTFAWSNTGSVLEGITYFLVFLKDVDTVSPIRDSDSATGSASPTTSSISTSTDDTLFCIGCSYDTNVDAGYGTGQTEIVDNGIYNSDGSAVGQKAGVATSTTMQISGAGTATAIAAVSVKGSTGGSAISIPIAMRHYRNLRQL